MSSIVATVKSIVGQVIAVSPEGIRRVLVEGDHLLAGEQVETGASGAVSLQLTDGRVLDMGRDSLWSAANPQVSTQAGEAVAPANAPSAEELQQAIADGVDPTKAFEAPAAGATQATEVGPGGDAGGGHSFVVLDATGETVQATVGYETAGLANGGEPGVLLTDGTPPLRASTLSLSATDSVVETGGQVIYTATVTQAPLSPLTVNLSNGQSIVIAAGSLTGSASVTFANANDAYLNAHTVAVGVTGTSGGEGLAISTDPAPAVTVVTDTLDPTQVSIGTPSATVGEGSTLTYTISVANAPQTNLVLTLSDGNTVTIAAGTTSVDYTVNVADANHGGRADDIYSQGTTTTTLSVIGVANGADGNLEAVVTTGASVTTNIVDALSGPGTETKVGFSASSAAVNEGADASYTVNVAPTTAPLVLILAYTGTATNGVDFTGITTVTLPAGQNTFTLGTLNDALLEGNESITLTLTGISGGGLENPTVDGALNSVTTLLVDQTAPAASGTGDTPLQGAEDTAINITWSDFHVQPGSANADPGVRINSVPGNGSLVLTLGAVASNVTAGSVITKAQLDSGTLLFTPEANAASTGAGAGSVQDTFASINFTALNNATSATPVAGATTSVALVVNAVADAAVFTVASPAGNVGNEDASITLSPIAITFPDTVDLSEVHAVTLQGMPAGTVVADANGVIGKANAVGELSIIGHDASTLSLQTPLNYNGTFTLTVLAEATEQSNGSYAPSQTTLQITVSAVNDAPVAGPGAGVGKEDVRNASGQLQASDVDIGDTLTYRLGDAANAPQGFTLNPATGDWTLDTSNAAYQYLAEGEQLVLQVPFTATDAAGASSSAVLTITVTGTNDVPTVQADAATVAEESSISGQLPARDTDTSDTLTYNVSAADKPAGFSVNPATGVWTLNANQPEYQHLAVGESQQIQIPFTVTDSNGATSTVEVLTLTITGTNDTPTVQADAATVAEDSSISGQLPARDADTSDTLTYNVSAADKPAGFTLNTATGQWTLDASNPAYQSLGKDQTLDIRVPFTVTDSNGATSTVEYLTITVRGSDDAIVIGHENSNYDQYRNTFTEGDTPRGVVWELTLKDADSATLDRAVVKITNWHEGDVLSIGSNLSPALVVSISADKGTITLSGPGTVADYQAALQSITYVNENQALNGETRKISVEVTDAAGGNTSAITAWMNVVPVNDAPVVHFDTATFVEQQGAQALVKNFTVSDVDNSQLKSIVVTVGNLKSGDLLAVADAHGLTAAIATAADGKSATITLTGTKGGNAALGDFTAAVNSITFNAPGQNPSGEARTLDIKVTDAGGNVYLSNEVPLATVVNGAVNVQLVNDAPLAHNDSGVSISGLKGNYYGYREGVDGSNLSNLGQVNGFIATHTPDASFVATSIDYAVNTYLGKSGSLASFLGNGSKATGLDATPGTTSDAIVELTGQIQVEAGTYTLRVTADDGYSIVIDGKQVIVFDANQSAGAKESASFTLDGNPHTLQIIYWDQGGVAKLAVEISKNGGSYVTLGGGSLTHDDLTTYEEQPLVIKPATLLANDSDPDGDVLSIKSVQGLDPVKGTVALDSAGNVVFNPAKDFAGAATFTYTITDGAKTATATVTVNVVNVNDAPTVTALTLPSTLEDQPLSFTKADLLAGAKDIDGDALSVSNVTASNGVITATATGYTFTPSANWSGPALISFKVSDGTTSVNNTARVKVIAVPDGVQLSLAALPTVTSDALVKTVWGPEKAAAWGLGTNGMGVGSSAALVGAFNAHKNEAYTSTGTTTLASASGVTEGTATKISGLVYLEAGKSYAFSGTADDSLAITVGGKVVATETWLHGSSITGNAFVPATSGYYTLAIYHFNQDGPGGYDVNVAINGQPATSLASSGLALYTSVADAQSHNAGLSALYGENGEGFHAVATVNHGTENSLVQLNAMTATLIDTDGSEARTVTLSGLKAGTVISYADGVALVTAGTSGTVDVSSLDLGKLYLKAPVGEYGARQITVSAYSTEASTQEKSAVSTATFVVTLDHVAPLVDLDVGDQSGAAGGDYIVAYSTPGSAVSIADSDLAISDKSGYLSGATITLKNAVSGVDSLAAGALPTGIDASAATVSGSDLVITLSGHATLADYQAAIKAITYSNSGYGASAASAGTRTVTVTVDDGTSASNHVSATATTLINVAAETYTTKTGTANSQGDELYASNQNTIMVGDVSTLVKGASYNLAFILDTSGSITNAVLDNIKAQIKQTLTSLRDNLSSTDANAGVVKVFFESFSTGTNLKIAVDDLRNADQFNNLMTKIDGLTSTGQTNYEAAFKAAADWYDGVGGTKDSNITYFITDGQPNEYVTDAGANSNASSTQYAIDQATPDYSRVDAVATVHAFGLGSNPTQGTLATFDSDHTPDTNVSVSDLASTIASSTSFIATTDTLAGGDGNDILFGDLVTFTTADGAIKDAAEALRAYVDAKTLGSAAITDQAMHQYITEHLSEFNGSASTVDGTLSLGGAGKADTLLGGKGNDILFGQAGNDSLQGGDGNDILIGGKGSDDLRGNAGADTFMWLKGDTNASSVSDHIWDFNKAEGDKIDLSDLFHDVDVDSANLGSFLSASVEGTHTTLKINSSGALNSSGSNADVTIQVDNVQWSNETIKSLVAGSDPTIKVDHHG
jgi:surface adhesion protein